MSWGARVFEGYVFGWAGEVFGVWRWVLDLRNTGGAVHPVE